MFKFKFNYFLKVPEFGAVAAAAPVLGAADLGQHVAQLHVFVLQFTIFK